MKLLGVVKWTGTDKVGNPIAGVQPIREVQKSEWREIDILEEFPPEGQVFWPVARTAVEHSLIFFRAEPNPRKKHEYKVVDPQRAIEVLDLRAIGGPTEVRAALLEGLHRPGIPTGRLMMWCKPNLLVGPIEIIRNSQGNLIFHPSNLAKIPTFAGSELRSISDGQQERLLRVDESPPSGYVDWDDDSAILKRALQAAVRLAKLAGKDTGQTKRQIEEAAEALAAEGVGPDAQLDLYRLQRAQGLSRDTGLIGQLAPEIAQSLLSYPSVTEHLAQFEAKVRSEIEVAARANVEQELSKEREALREVTSAREQAQEQLIAQTQSLDEARKRAVQAAEEIEAAMRARVQSALERPAELLAESSVLGPLLVQNRSAPSQTQVGPNVQQSGLEWSHCGGDPISDRAALQRSLISAARSRGVAPAAMLQLHAAVASGLVPITVGPGALGALAAYSHAVCGARIAVLHVSPGCIRPCDLLGEGNGDKFTPHATGLLAAASAALAVNAPSLLVLEGANRSPLESCLLPILQVRREKLPIVVSDLGDPLRLPPNLLLAATIVTGVTTVPVTPDLFCHAVAVEVEAEPIVASGGAATELPMTSELFSPVDGPVAEAESLVEAWPDCNEVRPALERFGAALLRLYDDGPRIRHALLNGIVLPFLVGTVAEDEQEDVLRRLSDTETSALTAATKRLRRRLR